MCLICKKDSEMLDVHLSNNIKINEIYGSYDEIKYCSYCGALFLESFNLDKYKDKYKDK